MSRKPGIGFRYAQTHRGWHLDDLRNYVMVYGFKARLPRFYKDKIFNAHHKELMRVQGQELAEKVYFDELERLSYLHPDPWAYYNERQQWEHDRIHVKINETNLF